jgi:extradiol dioxygenase family protein
LKIRVFHVAIPCRSLDEAEDFYVNKLGARLARRYADRITLEFFNQQVVCHLCPDKIDPDPQMYPRHFGVTFSDREDFNDILDRARKENLHFFQEPFIRFKGMAEEHSTFFLKDPSNNLLEFKLYNDPTMIY